MEKLYLQDGHKRTQEIEEICLAHTDVDTLGECNIWSNEMDGDEEIILLERSGDYLEISNAGSNGEWNDSPDAFEFIDD